MRLTELLARRESLRMKEAGLASELESVRRVLQELDSELFGRVRTLVDAIEGGRQSSPHESASQSNLLPGVHQVFLGGVRLRPAIKKESKLEPAIVDALKEIGRPASRNEVFDAMTRRGVEVPGKDPRANLSAHLSYSGAIERTPDGLWSLVEWRVGAEKQTPA